MITSCYNPCMPCLKFHIQEGALRDVSDHSAHSPETLHQSAEEILPSGLLSRTSCDWKYLFRLLLALLTFLISMKFWTISLRGGDRYILKNLDLVVYSFLLSILLFYVHRCIIPRTLLVFSIPNFLSKFLARIPCWLRWGCLRCPTSSFAAMKTSNTEKDSLITELRPITSPLWSPQPSTSTSIEDLSIEEQQKTPLFGTRFLDYVQTTDTELLNTSEWAQVQTQPQVSASATVFSFEQLQTIYPSIFGGSIQVSGSISTYLWIYLAFYHFNDCGLTVDEHGSINSGLSFLFYFMTFILDNILRLSFKEMSKTYMLIKLYLSEENSKNGAPGQDISIAVNIIFWILFVGLVLSVILVVSWNRRTRIAWLSEVSFSSVQLWNDESITSRVRDFFQLHDPSNFLNSANGSICAFPESLQSSFFLHQLYSWSWLNRFSVFHACDWKTPRAGKELGFITESSSQLTSSRLLFVRQCEEGKFPDAFVFTNLYSFKTLQERSIDRLEAMGKNRIPTDKFSDAEQRNIDASKQPLFRWSSIIPLESEFVLLQCSDEQTSQLLVSPTALSPEKQYESLTLSRKFSGIYSPRAGSNSSTVKSSRVLLDEITGLEGVQPGRESLLQIPLRDTRLSHVVILIDSVSSHQFSMNFPETLRVLQRQKNFLRFHMFHSNGYNSDVNLKAHFTYNVDLESDIPGTSLFQHFQESGYVTALLSETCEEMIPTRSSSNALLGIDHEWITQICHPEFTGVDEIEKFRHSIWYKPYGTQTLCLGGKESFFNSFQYATKFFEIPEYKDKRKIIYLYFTHAHEMLGRHLSCLDRGLSRFLKSFYQLHKQHIALHILSDHGLHMGLSLPLFTVNRVEQLLPTWISVFPDHVKIPDIAWTNKYRLVSNIDVYRTLYSLTYDLAYEQIFNASYVSNDGGKLARRYDLTSRPGRTNSLESWVRNWSNDGEFGIPNSVYKGLDVFTQESPRHRSCPDAGIHPSLCKCA